MLHTVNQVYNPCNILKNSKMQWDIVDNLFTLSEVCTQLIRSFGVFKGKLFPTQIITCKYLRTLPFPYFRKCHNLWSVSKPNSLAWANTHILVYTTTSILPPTQVFSKNTHRINALFGRTSTISRRLPNRNETFKISWIFHYS